MVQFSRGENREDEFLMRDGAGRVVSGPRFGGNAHRPITEQPRLRR
jgi:hypothetical protein